MDVALAPDCRDALVSLLFREIFRATTHNRPSYSFLFFFCRKKNTENSVCRKRTMEMAAAVAHSSADFWLRLDADTGVFLLGSS